METLCTATRVNCAQETRQHDVRRAFSQHGEMGRASGCRGICMVYGGYRVVYETSCACGASRLSENLRESCAKSWLSKMVLEVGAGARVVLQGLTARPELNGRHGTVTDAVVTDASGETRWPVYLDPTPAAPRGHGGVKVKTSNLHVLCVRRPSSVAPVPSAETLAGIRRGLLNDVSATLELEMSKDNLYMGRTYEEMKQGGGIMLMNQNAPADSKVLSISLKVLAPFSLFLPHESGHGPVFCHLLDLVCSPFRTERLGVLVYLALHLHRRRGGGYVRGGAQSRSTLKLAQSFSSHLSSVDVSRDCAAVPLVLGKIHR